MSFFQFIMSLFKRPQAKPAKPLSVYDESYKPSPNKGRKKGHKKGNGIDPKYIILHHSYGSFKGGVSWIRQSKSKVSYHYLIDRDGSRVQFVYDRIRAWHAGRSNWKNITGMNDHSIGISFFGDTYNRDVSFAEIDSCAEKCIYLMEKLGIPIENILTHKQIAPMRKNDPSPDTHNRVIQRIKERQKIKQNGR